MVLSLYFLVGRVHERPFYTTTVGSTPTYKISYNYVCNNDIAFGKATHMGTRNGYNLFLFFLRNLSP